MKNTTLFSTLSLALILSASASANIGNAGVISDSHSNNKTIEKVEIQRHLSEGNIDSKFVSWTEENQAEKERLLEENLGSKFANQTHIGKEDRFANQTHIGKEDRFANQTHIGKEDRFANQTHIGKEDRFANQTHIGKEDRFAKWEDPSERSGGGNHFA